MNIVYALLGISFLVFVHEVGHFVAARLCKIPVLSFAVGFGPAIFKYQYKGTEYRLNLLPVGGYVATPAEETKLSAVHKRLFFYSAGVLMNVLTAVVFLTILFSVTGVPIVKGVAVSYGDTVPLLQGLGKAVTASMDIMGKMFVGFYELITGGVSMDQVGGPVQIVQMTGQASELGVPFFLYFLSILSLNLAVLNLLPFPSLDGSHLLFTLLEIVRRGKRISLERESMVHFVGIMIMFALMVLVTVKDLGFFFER
jgi:membrane-associated protease RseP (regulator of RpoE activity)